jgi:hypothetical protein
LANKHRQGFQQWEPNKYRSSSLTPDIFKVWYERVTDPDFVARATFCCAQMWVGASATAEQTGRIAQLKGAGRYQGLNEVLTFFERINRTSLYGQLTLGEASGAFQLGGGSSPR